MTGLTNKIDVRDFGQIEQTDEAMLIYEVSDEAIENAAGSVKEKVGAFTLAFCSGVDTCPS
jgi:hypothetical protein